MLNESSYYGYVSLVFLVFSGIGLTVQQNRCSRF